LGGEAENLRPENDGLENDGHIFSKLRTKLRGLEIAGLENDERGGRRADLGSAAAVGWTALLLLLLLLLLLDVAAILVVVVADLLREKPGAVYPEAVAYGAQKLV